MWPDIVTPTLAARAAFVNPDGNATALTLDGGGFRSVFFTFPFEGLPADGRLEVMRRILNWFGPLRASTFAVDRAVARPGDDAGLRPDRGEPGPGDGHGVGHQHPAGGAGDGPGQPERRGLRRRRRGR